MRAALLKSNWSPLSVLGVLLLLLGLVLSNVGGTVINFPDHQRLTQSDTVLTRASKMATLFENNGLAALLSVTNGNPFYTTYYQPPPEPKPPPTKKVELVYHGFYQTADGKKLAFVHVADRVVVAPAGTEVAAGFTITEIEFESVKLTNSVGTTTLLPFKTKKQLEIPTSAAPK